jgi:hypothetical protein
MAEYTQQDLEKLLQAVNKLSQIVAAKEAEATEKTDETSALLELVLKREARLEEKEKDAQIAFAQRDKQRRANAREFDANLKLIQSRCKHKKGAGKKFGGMPDGRNDYSIVHHVFINHSEMKMCQICKMKWHPGDTHTSLIRNGKILPNHTKLSWEEVSALPTTNTMTASEAPIAPATMERDVATKLLDLMKDKDVSKVMAFLKSPEGQHFTNDQSAPTTEVAV